MKVFADVMGQPCSSPWTAGGHPPPGGFRSVTAGDSAMKSQPAEFLGGAASESSGLAGERWKRFPERFPPHCSLYLPRLVPTGRYLWAGTSE